MAWDEWEQLKSGAAHGDSARMQLNGYPAADGGGDVPHRGGYPSAAEGGPDLVVYNDELAKLGTMAQDLLDRFRVDSDHARPATFDASVELFNDGLDMGAALTELHDAWSTKTKTVKDACGRIHHHLQGTKKAHANDEAETVRGMSNIAQLDKWMKKD